MSTIKEKIEGLLAKAEGTTNEHERDAYTKKAEALMLKYGIEQAELEAVGKAKREEIVHEMITIKSNFKAIVPVWVSSIVRSLGSLEVLQLRGSKQWVVHMYIIGYKSDVDHAVTLINSLWNQAILAVAVWRKGEALLDPIYAASDRQYRWRADREFVSAFGLEVARRIREERTVQEEKASTGAALVLVDKKERVSDWMHSQFAVGKGRQTSIKGAYSGAAAGREAGRRANIGRSELR